MSLKNIIVTAIAILVLVCLDQASKEFLVHYLKTQPGYMVEFWPFLDIIYTWNYGISFGLFREYFQYSNYIFLVLNSTIIIYIICLLRSTKELVAKIGIILIIGGALGNLADRIYRGAVFDFIHVNYGWFSFPAFNLADAFITIGACFFFYSYLFISRENF
jgi:signal peptidase II